MASVHQFPQRNNWRIGYYIRIDRKSIKKAKYAKTKADANLLKRKLERVEDGCKTALASKKDIDEWVQQGWLKKEEAEQIFIGYKETIARVEELVTESTDYDQILSAYEDYSADNSKGGVFKRTHKTNMGYARQVVAWLRADYPDLKKLDEEGVKSWLVYLKQSYAEWSVFHHFTKLRLLLDQAIRFKMISDNPARKMNMRQPRVASARRILDEKEIRIILEVSLHHRRWINGGIPTVVRLGLYAGLRNEEMIWLKWDCVDFKSRILTIKETTCELTGEKWKPKDYEMRRLDIKDACSDYLKQEQERQKKEKILGPFLLPGGGARRLHHGDKPYFHKPLSSDAPQKAFAKMIHAQGLDKDITIYCFRHTYATMGLRSGIDLRTVQKNMGHSKIETTMEYLHYIEPERHPTDKLPY